MAHPSSQTVTAIVKDPQLSWDGGTPMHSSGQRTYPLPTHNMHLRTTKVHGTVYFERLYKLHTNLVVLLLTNGLKMKQMHGDKAKAQYSTSQTRASAALKLSYITILLIQPPPAKTKHMPLAL